MKLLAAGSIVVLGAILGVVPGSSAEEGEGPTPGSCSPAELKRLKKLGDNFADACFLPGQELGQVPGAKARLDEGDQDSLAMALRAEVPFSESATEGEPSPFDEESVGSDIAFKGNYAFAGNYDGVSVYDISNPGSPETVAQLDCPGPQNDISVYRDLLVLSVDNRRTDDSCSSEAVPPGTPVAWEGIRVVDISDPTSPEVVANVETDCGSHTHTLAPSRNGENLFVYVSSYGPNEALLDCQPPHDKISIVKVPVADGSAAELVSTPVLFPDGGYEGSTGKSATSGCHDITAYPSKDLAAGACMGDGILMDISRRARPTVIEQVRDTENFAFWHSATFNNDGTKVVFTDELGGGAAATCNDEVGPKRGADGIYDIVRKQGQQPQLKFRSYFKIPRTNASTENCVAHNGSLVPVEGRDIMVQAWYQGGISVFDFTDSRNPKEVAWFDRGTISEDELVLGGIWSAYWYNGHVYANDITRGLGVYSIDKAFARKAAKVRMSVFNAQSQPSFNG